MPTKTEFKFDCPKCGQHILVAIDWFGLGISCPSCQSRISIPAPLRAEHSLKPATSRQPTKTTIRIELPPKSSQNAAGSNGHPVGLNGAEVVLPKNLTGKETWAELVERVEKGVPAEPAVLVTALFHELSSVRRRLEEVERMVADRNPNPTASGRSTDSVNCSNQNSDLEKAK